jgi:hypothetical protein
MTERNSRTTLGQRNFILVDCGGGTTDIAMFRIGHTSPLRLSEEILDAIGKIGIHGGRAGHSSGADRASTASEILFAASMRILTLS